VFLKDTIDLLSPILFRILNEKKPEVGKICKSFGWSKLEYFDDYDVSMQAFIKVVWKAFILRLSSERYRFSHTF